MASAEMIRTNEAKRRRIWSLRKSECSRIFWSSIVCRYGMGMRTVRLHYTLPLWRSRAASLSPSSGLRGVANQA